MNQPPRHALPGPDGPGRNFIDVAGAPMPVGEVSDAPDLLHYVRLLLARKFLIMALAAGGGLLGYLISLPQAPVYRAETSLEVQDQNDSFLNMGEVDPNSRSYAGESKLQTELEMLESRSLRRLVRQKLSLPTDSEDFLDLEQAPLLTTMGLGSLSARPTRESALNMAQSSLTVSNPRMTRIVKIMADSTDPKIAADFVNTLADTYKERTIEGRLASYQEVGEWLNQQLAEIQKNMKDAEAEFVRYSKESGLVLTAEADSKLQQLQQQLARSEAELLERKSRLKIASTRSPDEVTDIATDNLVQSYELRLIGLQERLSELRTTFKPGHYKVERVETQIAELRKAMEAERQQVIERLRNDVNASEARRSLLAEAYGEQAGLVTAQSQKLLNYNMLKREVEANQELYRTMSQRVKEASMASALQASNISIVDPAEPPSSPYKPAPVKNAMIGGSTGLFLGVVFVFMRSSSEKKFTSPSELSTVLGARELGAVAAGGGLKRNGLLGPRADLIQAQDQPDKNLSITKSRFLAEKKLTSNQAFQLESVRGIVTSLVTWRNENERTLLFTSAEAGAGKTSVVSNIGCTVAEVGQRVLLIDADMRRPRLHRVFNISNSWGLSDLAGRKEPIDQSMPVEALCKPTAIEGLYVLPSGPGSAHVARLLHSDRIPELIDRVKDEFDTILIDSPPVLSVADARLLGRYADGVVMVVRAGYTTQEMALSAYHRFLDDGAHVVGAILNDWNPKADYRYGYRNHHYN